MQLRNDIATLQAQHAAVVQRLADDRSEVRQLAAERSTLEHSVGLAKEQQQRWTLQLETTRRELEVYREERKLVVQTTAENRAKFEGLREVCLCFFRLWFLGLCGVGVFIFLFFVFFFCFLFLFVAVPLFQMHATRPPPLSLPAPLVPPLAPTQL